MLAESEMKVSVAKKAPKKGMVLGKPKGGKKNPMAEMAEFEKKLAEEDAANRVEAETVAVEEEKVPDDE